MSVGELDPRIELEKYTERERIPEAIGVIVTQVEERLNVCPVKFQVISSIYELPLCVMVGLSNSHHTLQSIQQSGEFTFAYPHISQVKDIIYCGTVSGREVDKVANTKLEFEASKLVKTPVLKGAVASYECKLLQSTPVLGGNFTLVLGQILKIHNSSLSPDERIFELGGDNFGVITGTKVVQSGRV